MSVNLLRHLPLLRLNHLRPLFLPPPCLVASPFLLRLLFLGHRVVLEKVLEEASKEMEEEIQTEVEMET